MQYNNKVAGAAATLLLAGSASAAATGKAVSTTVAYPQPSTPCMSGALIVVARGSTEPQGEGIIGAVATMVAKAIPNSMDVAVTYPATIGEYPFSEQEGVVGMKQIVTDYINQCPNGNVALIGYSQGGQVVGDTVIGSQEEGFSDESTNPVGLGQKYLDRIFALIMMGDPSFKVGTPGHVGNATTDGVFPRQNVDAFSQYKFDTKMQTYCVEGDLFCASGKGKDALAIHENYIQPFASSAAAFVVSQFSALPAATGSPSSAGGSSSGAASSASSAMTSAAAKTSASAASKVTSQAAVGGAAGGSSSKSGSQTIAPALTSNRYHPYTGTFSGSFTQLQNLQNDAGVQTMERGLAGTVFGAAMFVMGML